MIHTHTHKSN